MRDQPCLQQKVAEMFLSTYEAAFQDAMRLARNALEDARVVVIAAEDADKGPQGGPVE